MWTEGAKEEKETSIRVAESRAREKEKASRSSMVEKIEKETIEMVKLQVYGSDTDIDSYVRAERSKIDAEAKEEKDKLVEEQRKTLQEINVQNCVVWGKLKRKERLLEERQLREKYKEMSEVFALRALPLVMTIKGIFPPPKVRLSVSSSECRAAEKLGAVFDAQRDGYYAEGVQAIVRCYHWIVSPTLKLSLAPLNGKSMKIIDRVAYVSVSDFRPLSSQLFKAYGSLDGVNSDLVLDKVSAVTDYVAGLIQWNFPPEGDNICRFCGFSCEETLALKGRWKNKLTKSDYQKICRQCLKVCDPQIGKKFFLLGRTYRCEEEPSLP